MKKILMGLAIVWGILAAPAMAMDKIAAPKAAAFEEATPGPTEKVTIVTKDGKRHDFNIEVVRDRDSVMKGLMFRTSMPADHGMLFVFPGAMEEQRAFWMKNTFIPLDIIFIAKDGTIRNIGQGVPQKLDSIPSDGPVMHVVELNAGTAEKLGIGPGDVVHHAVFGNPLEP